MAGNLCHFEIPARNIEKAGQFYSKVFGWKISDSGFPGYSFFETSKPPHGGIEKREPFSNGVMLYIQVDEDTAAINNIKSAGGSIVKEKTEIPNIGWFGLFSDPDGNIIGIFQSKNV